MPHTYNILHTCAPSPVLHAYCIQQAHPEGHLESETGPRGEFLDEELHGSFDSGDWFVEVGWVGKRGGSVGFYEWMVL